MQEISLLETKIKLSPMEFAHYLQGQGDIFWREQEKFWVITSHYHAKTILVDNNFSCNRAPFFIANICVSDLQVISDFLSVVSKMMVMSDAPEHIARRRICYDGFSNKTLQDLYPLMMKTIQRQIAKSLKKGHLELVEDIAKIIPSTILADFFHIPESERHDFYEWSNNMTQFFGGTSEQTEMGAKNANKSASHLRDYFHDLIKERRKQPRTDFLSILLNNQSAFQLQDEEIISQAIMMLVAGQVTTTDQLCNNMYTLLTSSTALERENLLAGKINLEDTIDELNRLDPAVTFIFRLAKKDTVIDGHEIKTNDAVFISSHAINRDPRVFSRPDQCDFYRKKNIHLSYGFGPHYCIGNKLAQLEMKNIFNELLRSFPGLHLTKDDLPKRKHHSLAFSGFERMSLQFNL